MKCFKVPKGRGGTKINKKLKNTHFLSFGRKKRRRATLNNNAKLYHCKILIKFSYKGNYY
jgi:hypothetical protein